VKQTISGAAKVGGIAGNPIGHSLSPVIHNAWIAAAGMDAAYVPFAPADAAGFEALVAAGRAGLLMGLNVTAPFKEQAFALADSASDAAKGSGSANVLVFRDGRIACDSTDGFGMMWAISDQAPGLGVRDRPVVILGAGGAARAAAGTLIAEGTQVRILNRSRDRAEALAADLGPSVSVVDEADAFEGAVLVINALSIQPTLDLARLEPGHGGDGHDLSPCGHRLPQGRARPGAEDRRRSGNADRSGRAVVPGHLRRRTPCPAAPAPAAGGDRGAKP
jgi:shikimate dehydrogenase